MRALANWSGALAGLMMILVGGLIPAALLLLDMDLHPKVLSLPSTWQVPALLLCALVCGPRAGVIAAVAYLTIGLVDLPVFHGGGGLSYVMTPGFGYLAGFVPAAWLSGRLAQQNDMNDVPHLTMSAIAGLIMLQLCGLLNLVIGSALYQWPDPLPELLFSYTLGPLPAQLVLCAGVGVLALPLRHLLFVE